MTLPIELVSSLDDGAKSAELAELLTEIAAMSDKITYERLDDDARRPSFAIRRVGTDIEVRFAGIPLGHEFTSLALALLQVGGYPSKEAPEVLEQVQGLEGKYHFETYFSLSCQNCPDVVQALNLMAVLNPGVSHVAIDGALYQDEVDGRQIMAVPTVYLNGELFGSGRMSSPRSSTSSTTAPPIARQPRSRRRTRSTCSSWVAARPELRPRSTLPARGFAPASPPSASAVRSSTRWRSRTTSRSPTPRARSSALHSRTTCASTTSTS